MSDSTHGTDQPRWRVLEEWIEENGVGNFTVYELARDLGFTNREASRHIQSYLTAQRGRRSETGFVLKRAGRTKRAVWSVGQTAVDARTIGSGMFDDFLTSMKRAYKPDLDRIREVNPRTARFIIAKMETMDAAVQLLAAALDAQVEEALFAVAEQDGQQAA